MCLPPEEPAQHTMKPTYLPWAPWSKRPGSDTRGPTPCGPEVHVAELRLSSERRGDSLIVAIGGELDIVTSRQLDDHLTRARRTHLRIVLDLTEVEFMDTSSLAVIVGHWKRLEAAGGALVLAGGQYPYTDTLWITARADRLPLSHRS